MPRPVALVPSAVLLLAGVVAAQGDVLDQSYLPNPQTNGLEVTAAQPVTQTFTVGLTGLLTRIEIAQINQHRGTPTQPLVVSLVTTAAGVPTTNALATVTVPPASVPAARGPLQVDLMSFGVQVQQGQVLGIALASAAAPGTQTYAWWGEAPGGSYLNGQVFIQGNVALSAWDLAFQTWVALPGSAVNYGNGHPGTNGVPTLTIAGPPRLGTTPLLLVADSAGVQTLGGLVFGLARANVPTPFGGTALVQFTASVTIVMPPAGGALPLPIPGVAAFAGLLVDVQAVVLDAGASQGIAFSPGLELQIGG